MGGALPQNFIKFTVCLYTIPGRIGIMMSDILSKGGDFMKNDPGLQEEKKIPELPKPSWFQVAGDVDDFIFYYETEKTCSQR